jgi:hypothetical protein
MTSAYFAPFVTLPVIIDAPGKYITRNGELVIVDTVSTKHDFGCLGYYYYYDSNEIPEQWHKSGRLYFSTESNNDIVSKV